MREQIRTVATELLIEHGVRGLRFGSIAERLAITRANIHYHFGTKQNLVDKVIEDYVRGTLERTGLIWSDPDLSYQEKVWRMMEFNRSRYDKANRDGRSGRSWSLVSRMRLETDQLSEKAREMLRVFTRTLEAQIDDAVAEAQRRGELIPTAPVKDIAIMMIAIVDSAGSITQDGGSFERLERLYTAHVRIIDHAYASRPGKRARARPTAGAGS